MKKSIKFTITQRGIPYNGGVPDSVFYSKLKMKPDVFDKFSDANNLANIFIILSKSSDFIVKIYKEQFSFTGI